MLFLCIWQLRCLVYFLFFFWFLIILINIYFHRLRLLLFYWLILVLFIIFRDYCSLLFNFLSLLLVSWRTIFILLLWFLIDITYICLLFLLRLWLFLQIVSIMNVLAQIFFFNRWWFSLFLTWFWLLLLRLLRRLWYLFFVGRSLNLDMFLLILIINF